MDLIVPNRSAAGRALASQLPDVGHHDDLLILALPRGGVPVAYEIATFLDAELDVLFVRKLGMPGEREVAMGAIASGGIQFLNEELIAAHQISSRQIADIVREERAELQRRERSYRGARGEPVIKGKVVVLVDDGLATGASMRVAVDAVRQRGAARIIVAVPVASVRPIDHLKQFVDDVVCLVTPVPFFSVSQWYREFPQVSDEEVKSLLELAWARNLKNRKKAM
jgi:predicted phosphoribosyltransferase